jgi:hypothetical protein
MVPKTPTVIVASLVLLAAGVAAANNILAGSSAGLAVNNGSVVAQTAPSTTGTTPSTVGPSTGTPGTVGTTPGTTTGTTPGTTTGTTNGATTNGTVTTPTGGTLAVDQVVSITRSVAPGTPVTAFTVPAGQQLVITDVLVTNPGTAPACGAQVSPTGILATTTPGTGAGTSEAGTGLLCVPAQTSLDLGLTTGLEFAAGQGVVLANTTTTTETATPATLHYHLRGFLMSAG